MASDLRERAEELTERLVSEFPQVSGVCLFGSVARGDEGPESDIDLLVVGDDPTLRPSSIRRRLNVISTRPRVSIVCHTSETLDRYVKTGSRFLVHVQKEGDILFDNSGQLRRIQKGPPLKTPIRAEVQGQLKRLSLYEDPSRYNGNFLFPLSHVFAIGKAIVMAILTENRVYEFNRDRAFDAFVTLFPDARHDIETLRRLSPFYCLVSKDIHQELPFSYHHSEAEIEEAVLAVKRLADHADFMTKTKYA